jgi:putative ABC transport system permease protein
MITYYLDLARRSLKRNVALTVLMIIAIAFGVGASMTTLTVMHVLAADPIPGHSQDLYAVQLQPRKLAGYVPGDQPPDQLTRRDAEALLRAHRADRQAMMVGGGAAIEPQRAGLPPFQVEARWTSSDFFPMFRVPFVAGSGWTAEDDAKNARVVVIAQELAEKVFGSTQVIGKTLRVEGQDMRVVGVIGRWRPVPHFYDLHVGEYSDAELLYAPFSTSREFRFSRSGSMDCWGDAPDNEVVGAPCVWIQFWAELDSKEKAAAYRDFLISYSEEEKKAGRYELPPSVGLHDVMGWLAYNEVVPDDARLQMWLALGFLVVCLVNTVGLLLTKFLRRSPEIGVRRALGASKRSIFVQLLVEAGVIGLVGGVLGLGLAYLGLWAVRQQPTEYAAVARLDMPMLFATFGLAIASSILAGILPAWRGCQISPATQLKSH